MDKMRKMGWGKPLPQALRGALGRAQTPPAAVRGSPMPRATPTSAGGALGSLRGHLCPQRRRWRGVYYSPSTTSLTEHLHRAGARVQLKWDKVTKNIPQRDKKRVGGDGERRVGATVPKNQQIPIAKASAQQLWPQSATSATAEGGPQLPPHT